ncbi:MAG: BlaI/MecI/CopY family transcriptional regulator [Candidatus Velthaea sp.]
MQSRVFRLDRAGTPSALGPLESRLMEIVWSLGGWFTVSDVVAQLKYKRGEKPLAYTTVKTVLTNLVEKRHLKKRSAGRANEFKAVLTRDAFQRAFIDDVIGPLLRNQRNPLLAHIVDELASDDDTYAEFERLLAIKRAERADD